MSDVARGLAYALVEDTDGPGLSDAHRLEIVPLLVEVPWSDAERDLRNAFAAIDWVFRSVVPSSLEALGLQHANDLRGFPQIVDSFHALCAKELCAKLQQGAPGLAALIESVTSAIEDLLWADAAVASRTGRAHPLARQVESYAASHAFSDPLDIGYLERTGEAVGRAFREALSLGVPPAYIASDLRDVWETFRRV